MMNYYNPPVVTEKALNAAERKKIRRTSNGIGFFVLIYFVVMQTAGSALIIFSYLFGIDATVSRNAGILFYIEIFAAVFSSFIPGLFYLLITRKSAAEILPFNRVGITKLIPYVMLGMGIAMIANAASEILNDNLSLFGFHRFSGGDTEVNNAFETMLYVISTALVPAFAEEFAFRGIVMGSLRKYGDALAILGSAILFGVMHGNASQTPFAFILGIFFAYIDCKTNSLLPSILIHFLNNFYAVVMDIMENYSNISENTVYIIYTAIVALMLLLSVLSFIYLIRTDSTFLRFSDKETTPQGNIRLLSFKDKMFSFMINAGIIISMSVFAAEIIFYLVY